jgi:hypothetical protein
MQRPPSPQARPHHTQLPDGHATEDHSVAGEEAMRREITQPQWHEESDSQ